MEAVQTSVTEAPPAGSTLVSAADLPITKRYYVVVRSVLVVLLFACWLLLFIGGMGVDSKAFLPTAAELKQPRFWQYADFWQRSLIYGLTFTPTNTAILASLAGALGGLASNLTVYNQRRYVDILTLDRQSDEFKSFVYMTESPLVSMLRGFLTYLIFITGSYITNFTLPPDAQNLGVSASAYFKFAMSVSMLAYLVGYDPMQLQGLISSLSFTKKKEPPATTLPPGSKVRETTGEVRQTVIETPPANGRVPTGE